MAEDVPNGAGENAETARGRGAESVAAARERFQRMGDDMQGRYRQVSEDVRRGAERASAEIRRGAERARESARGAGEQARIGYERIRTDAGQISRDVSNYVRENPARSVAIAAGVGFLLGLLARRGRDVEE